MAPKTTNALTLWLLIFYAGLSNPQDAEHLTAMVGDSIVFNCHIEFPEAHPVPYVIQWEKKVLKDQPIQVEKKKNWERKKMKTATAIIHFDLFIFYFKSFF